MFGGDSAGAQLALQFVNIQVNDKYQNRVNIERTVPKETIKGAVSFCGLLDLKRFDETDSGFANLIFSRAGWSYFGKKDWKPTENAKQASIVGNTNQAFPPLFITDGNQHSFEDRPKKSTILF